MTDTNREDTATVLGSVMSNLPSTLYNRKTPSVGVTPYLPVIGLTAAKQAMYKFSLDDIVIRFIGERFSLSKGKLTYLGT